MTHYDFTPEQISDWEKAVLQWATSSGRADRGPTIGYDNGFVGWKYEPSVDRRNGTPFRISFGINGEPPLRVLNHVRALYVKLKTEISFASPAEHRGSRPGPDPAFADAAFGPLTPEEKEMMKEKVG